MECPNCHKNSIPFFRVWRRSGFGTYRCPDCGAVCRVKKSALLFVLAVFLGGLAGGLGLYFRSWIVLVVGFAVAMIIDALIDWRCRRLATADQVAGGEGPDNIHV